MSVKQKPETTSSVQLVYFNDLFSYRNKEKYFFMNVTMKRMCQVPIFVYPTVGSSFQKGFPANPICHWYGMDPTYWLYVNLEVPKKC